MHFQMHNISPASAAEMLTKNIENRPLSTWWVNELAEAMERGEWVANGETIKFDTEGNLRDGQHRLHAVIKYGKNVEMAVVRGIPPEAFKTLDRHRRRTNADIMALAHVPESRLIAPITTWIMTYEAGMFGQVKHKRNPTAIEALDVYARHPGIAESATFIHGFYKKFLGSESMHAFLHYQFSLRDKGKADDFYAALLTGENLGSSHPALMLRERLIDNQQAKRKMDPTEVAALTIKAWNYFVSDEPLYHLKYSSHGTLKKENFPRILPEFGKAEVVPSGFRERGVEERRKREREEMREPVSV